MQLTSTEKLIFITTFMIAMNWGVRLTQIVIRHALY